MGTKANSKIGKRGTIVLPARLRRQFGMEEGSLIVAEACQDGILIRPAAETYTPERRAEFLLSNAVDAKDYERAGALVRAMGLNPAEIHHRKPKGS